MLCVTVVVTDIIIRLVSVESGCHGDAWGMDHVY